MKTIIKRFILIVFVCFLSVSCNSGNNGRSSERSASARNAAQNQTEGFSAEKQRVFSAAGLPLLSQKMAPREFNLPLVTAPAVPENLIRNVSVSSLKGKVVLLNFWATWCPPCRDEMPSMESLYGKFKDRGFEILAVNSGERNQVVYDFMQNYNFTFPAVLDINGAVTRSYGVQAIPTSFILDSDGMIILRFVGFKDWDTPEIHAALEMLLD